MKFRDVVVKNFLGNIKQYLSFFFCSTFSITIFFMYTTILFNERLLHGEVEDFFSYVMPITIVAISLFSIFFIVYANMSFVKSRAKEFGVYMTLGMNQKELKRLVTTENIIISVASLVTGITFGSLFSRLFQMLVIQLLEVNQITYYLDYKSFVVTILVFVLIFIFVFFQTNHKMNKVEISSLLREARKTTARPFRKRDFVYGSLGLMLLLSSIPYLLAIANHETLNSNVIVIFSYLLILFGGIYLIIARGGNGVLHLLRRSPRFRKHLFAIAELQHNYSQNTRVLFVLSILSTMIIIFVASPYSLLQLTESIAMLEKNTIEYVEANGMNKLEDSKRMEVLESYPIKKYDKVEFLIGRNEKTSYPVVSIQEYNKRMDKQVTLHRGEVRSLILNWQPGKYGVNEGSTLTLQFGQVSQTMKVVAAGHEEFFAGLSYPSSLVLLVNEEDYIELKEKVDSGNYGYYHMMKYENWRDTKEIIEKLSESVGSKEYPIVSVYGTYTSLKQGYATMLFVMYIVALLFFIAEASVLYFRQFSELPKAKERYNQLYKLGITTKEVRSIIGKELKVIYFTPVLLGIFAGISFIYLFTHIVSGQDVIQEFMKNSCFVTICYCILQGVLYWVTKQKYCRELN